ncbi:MAG: FtsX-like permease family protein [Planctomycetaceae bacterium]|nr:FtsX-like permease family protein [Planctomycetaceae bacterium]
MYKLLLCWRYLLTRFIALASVVSVMLGVATMIVVNAVMLGFTSEMKDRIQGILSDVIFQSRDLNKGFPHYDWHREQIFNIVGDLIEELTPVAAVPGMLTYRIHGSGEPVSFQVDIVGIDVLTQGNVSRIASYLQHPENRQHLSFDLRDEGYDFIGDGGTGPHREMMKYAGWGYRRYRAAQEQYLRNLEQQTHYQEAQPSYGESYETHGPPVNPFASIPSEAAVFDRAKEQHAGIIVGLGVSLRQRSTSIDPETGNKIVEDDLMLLPGDDVMLSFPTAELPLRFQSDSFTVVDLYESKMAEYDRKLVFVPINQLQRLRGMVDAESGEYTVTQILIKAKPGADINEIRDRLRNFFIIERYSINTWRDDQEQLLNAIFTELAMLNVLLFLIFAVAGFGILAIFYMIVIEKQKDIGILKALGASSFGVMQIFLYYSLLLGVVGCALGLGLGLLFVKYIQEIALVLSYVLQRDIFSPEVYSFYEIPTVVDIPTVIGIIIGAILIAVLAGVLPAMRAARVHPVETLRS